MIRVTVKRDGKVIGSETLFTQEYAEKWLRQQEAKEAFGKPTSDTVIPAVWGLSEEEKDEEGNIIKEAEAILIEPEKTVHYDADYTVEYEDVTVSVEKQKRRDRAIALQFEGMAIIAEIYLINEGKKLTIKQFNEIFDSPILQKIERLIRQGSFSTARYFISKLDDSFYTNEEKQDIIQMLNDALAR